MRKDIIKLVSSMFAGVGLLIPYLVFLQRFSLIVNISDMSQIESIILYSQIIRVIVLLVVGLRYQIQPIIPIILLSVEALLIPPLLVLIILTGASYYAALMGVILTAWFGATAVALPPYTIYIFARDMARGSSLAGTMVVGILEVATVLFLSTLLSGTNTIISGLTGLGMQIISQIRNEVGTGGVPNPAGQALSSLGLLLFFLALLFYMTIGSYALNSKINLPWILVVPLIATFIAFIWTFEFALLQSDIILVLTIPTIGLFLTIWGISRGK